MNFYLKTKRNSSIRYRSNNTLALPPGMDRQPFFRGRGMIIERGKEGNTGDLRGGAVFPTERTTLFVSHQFSYFCGT